MFMLNIMSADQLMKMNRWKLDQEKKYDRTQTGAIGGEYTYSITPTSMFTVIIVSNAMTKDEIDLTDYDF